MRSAHAKPWETAFWLSGASISPCWVRLGRLIVVEWLVLGVGRFHQALDIGISHRQRITAPHCNNVKNRYLISPFGALRLLTGYPRTLPAKT